MKRSRSDGQCDHDGGLLVCDLESCLLELDPGREVIVVLRNKSHLERAFVDAGITGAWIVEPGK